MFHWATHFHLGDINGIKGLSFGFKWTHRGNPSCFNFWVWAGLALRGKKKIKLSLLCYHSPNNGVSNLQISLQKNLILAGLEPAIPWFVVRCLVHWATGPLILSLSTGKPKFDNIATKVETAGSEFAARDKNALKLEQGMDGHIWVEIMDWRKNNGRWVVVRTLSFENIYCGSLPFRNESNQHL